MYHKVWFQNTLSAFQTLTNVFKHCWTLKKHKVAIVGSAGFHWAVVPDSTSFDSVFRPKGVWEQSKKAFVLPLSSSIFYFPALVVQTNSLMDFWSHLRLTITICCFKASAEIERMSSILLTAFFPQKCSDSFATVIKKITNTQVFYSHE